MTRDHETTSPEAAGVYERNHTPAIHPEWPDLSECVGATVDPDPAFAIWLTARHMELDRLRAEQTRSWRPMRCAHGHCRTSLDDDTAVYCGHGRPFCGNCVFEEGCDDCDQEATA